MIYYFICFPLLLLFRMPLKEPGLTKYKLQYGGLPYKKEVLVQYGDILLDISYRTLWPTIQCGLQCSLVISLPIQYVIWFFHSFWFIYIDKKIFKIGRGKGDRHDLRSFKHKGMHKIWWYPNYLMILTAYKVQGCWAMILSLVKSNPDGSNFR